MNLRTIETSAADVAAALELIMPFGHGNRIPQQYIADKTREIELRNQHEAEREEICEAVENEELPADETPLVVKENLDSDPIEDAGATETEEDLVDHEETPRSVASTEEPSLTTEEMSSVESSEYPIASSTDVEDTEDHHIEQQQEEGESQSEAEEENVSIAGSFDFTISVSISEDEEAEDDTGDHLSAVPEESTAIEVIMTASMAEEDNILIAEAASEEKDTKSLLVNDSMTSLDESKRSVSPSVVKSHIIDIAVEDGEEEYFQSTTSRDSFLIKLSLLGALSDVIYDDFVEQVCEYKALVMTIVKRYDVCLLREIEKPPKRKPLLKEVKSSAPKVLEQEAKKQEGPRPEEKFKPLRERKQVLHLEPLELPDFSYVEELVKQTKSQLKKSAESARQAVAQETHAQLPTVQEDTNDEVDEELLSVEELNKQSEAQIQESVEPTEKETIHIIDVEELVEDDPEPIEPELGKGSFDDLGFDKRDEELEEREDVESRDAEEVVDVFKPAMLQGSRQPVPKFRAVIEILDDDDEPSTPEQSSSVELSKQNPSECTESQGIKEVRESAEESVPRSSAFSKPKRKLTTRSANRYPFAATTTMATIRAEVEAKYSKMDRPTASFDRETLYAKSRTETSSTHMTSIARPYRKLVNSIMMAQKAVSVTSAYKAPEVRVATPYSRGRTTSEPAMPEIIDLVDAPEPPVVNLVDVPEPIVMAE